MAKKGAVQQLQAELNSDEDFEKFMERDGLLVIDVYTEWCGPCVGMIGSLKKIKLELGGDNLNLAICKADTVSYMERFRNKSEPTWLFASHTKIVNCLFGTNVPELMQTITDELTLEEKYKAGQYQRKFFEWTELTPIEQERENKRIAKEQEIQRIEQEASKKRRNEYLTFVTNEIMDRLPDAGVTLVMSNYAKERDIIKKLTEPADKCGLNMKDKRIITIKESDLEVILFDVTNPLHSEIYKKLFTEEILAVYWKTHDTELRDVLDLMSDFVDSLCNPQPLINEDGQPDPELKMPPIFKPWKFDVPHDIYQQIIHDMGIEEEDKHNENEEVATDGAEATPADGATAATKEADDGSKPPAAEIEAGSQQEKTTADAATGAPDADGTHSQVSPGTEDRLDAPLHSDDSAHTSPRPDDNPSTSPQTDTPEANGDNVPPTSAHSPENSQAQSPPQSKPSTPTSGPPTESHAEGAVEPAENAEVIHNSDSKASVVTFEQGEDTGLVTLNVPAIYAAANKRGNASLIYLYFRHLTDHFLPPDPVPEPPHVAVIFDAIKRKDVCQLMATMNEGDVLAYGYFSGIDPDTAHLLAKTNDSYAERKFNMEDKMVLKVAKATSNVLLNFVGLGPTFVSFSTEEGKEECKKFFPVGYNEEDEDETSSVDSSSSKKKRKKKKKKDGSGSDLGISEGIAEEAEEGADDGDLPDDNEATIVDGTETAAPPGEVRPSVAEGTPAAEAPPATETAPAPESAPATVTTDGEPSTQAAPDASAAPEVPAAAEG